MDKNIVLSFRFMGLLSQKEAIDFFSNLFINQFNKTIGSLNYNIIDKTTDNWKLKSKSVKYTEKNKKKYFELISSVDDKHEIDFELVRYLENAFYKYRDIDFSILYNMSDKINSINIVLNYSEYNDTDWKSFVNKIVRFIINQGCKICYGFMFSIENEKNPPFYVEGISNGILKKREEKKLIIWLNNKFRICNEKIWDVFWGNIISTYDNKIINDIKNMVDKNNFLQLSSNIIWFNLKESLKDFDILKYSEERKKLYNYFKSKGLILVF